MKKWTLLASVVLLAGAYIWSDASRSKRCSHGAANGKTYVVKASTPCNHSRLMEVMYRCQKVVLNSQEPASAIQRIRQRWDGMVHEMVDGGVAPAVTRDKRTIHVCLDDDPSVDALTFVVLHELSHIGCRTVGHTDEFWDVFMGMLKTAAEMGLYTEHDPTEKVCGTVVGPPPTSTSRGFGGK